MPLHEALSQVSIMSIFEYYRMDIPMFVPSPELLADWQLKHRVMDERTWSGVFKRFRKDSAIEQHPSSNVPFDPNNEFDAVSFPMKMNPHRESKSYFRQR